VGGGGGGGRGGAPPPPPPPPPRLRDLQAALHSVASNAVALGLPAVARLHVQHANTLLPTARVAVGQNQALVLPLACAHSARGPSRPVHRQWSAPGAKSGLVRPS